MPVSDKQIEANRTNARHSTGPKSTQGKAASSRNALKHGLTAKDLVVHPDCQEEFDVLAASLRHDVNPQTDAEMLVFLQLLSAAWRLLRCDRAEAELALRTSEPDPLLDPALQPTLRTIATARSQAVRQQKSAAAELRILQSERFVRQELIPDHDPAEHGLANLRTLLLKVQRHYAREEAAAELAAIMAPPPMRFKNEEEYAEYRDFQRSKNQKTKPSAANDEDDALYQDLLQRAERANETWRRHVEEQEAARKDAA